MKRSDIKTAFGGEVNFTKFIARDNKTAERLLNALDMTYEDGYTITPESHTLDDKRVDLVVKDSEGEVALVVESQDATGWLDSVHSSKITYYMYDKGCYEAALICEDADEHVKGFVKFLNENTPFRITLLSVVIFELENQQWCEFVPLMRPSALSEKKIRQVDNSAANQLVADRVQQIGADYPGLFTHLTRSYASKNYVGDTCINVGIHPVQNHCSVMVYHRGKHNNDDFKSSFVDLCKANNVKPMFQKNAVYVNEYADGRKIENPAEAVTFFKLFVKAVEDKTLKV